MLCGCKKKKYTVRDLINPPLVSNFAQHIQAMKEDIYASSKVAPLGRSHAPVLPSCVLSRSWTFGRATEFIDSVGDLMYPCLLCGTPGPLGDSPDNRPGACYSRTKEFLETSKPAGIKIKCDPSGSGVKTSMTWHGDGNFLNLVPVPVDEFREKHQYCIAKALTPENMEGKLSSSYQFGKKIDPQADMMDQALTYNYAEPLQIPEREFRRERGLLHNLRNLLKMKNYHHFDDLMSAFKEYDKNNCGKVNAHDIKRMCEKFDLSVSLNLVERLIADCDLIDKDGLIDYKEFIHFLNWKDKLPENYDYRIKAKKYHNEWVEGMVDVPTEITDNFKTVTSISFPGLLQTSGTPAGIPTVRVDRQIPDVRRLRNRKHYGEIRDISSLLQPNIFADHGVYDEDLYAPRTKEEVKLVFENCNIQINPLAFEDIWEKNHENEKLSIENFRKALDDYIWKNHRCNIKSK